MKRVPRDSERALVHVTLNTADLRRFAISDDNYPPDVLRQLREVLPKVPGFPQWEVACNEAGSATPSYLNLPERLTAEQVVDVLDAASGAVEFWVSVSGNTVSRNRACWVLLNPQLEESFGKTQMLSYSEVLMLHTELLGPSEELTHEELSILADLEQCVGIVLTEPDECAAIVFTEV